MSVRFPRSAARLARDAALPAALVASLLVLFATPHILASDIKAADIKPQSIPKNPNVVRVSIDQLHQLAIVPVITGDGEDAINPRVEVADWSGLADEAVYRSQLRKRAFSAILALPAIYRAPVMLRDIQGMSTEEASAVLKVKDQTLKSRLHRGRLILRKQLADFAGGLTLHHATA